MITVKLYGLLRVESGIKEKQLEAKDMNQVFSLLSDCGLARQDLQGCLILINGTAAKKRSTLRNGDTVVLISPVAGG